MTHSGSTFVSTQATRGRRGGVAGLTFGRRKQPPTQDAAFRKARLEALAAEIELLFGATETGDQPLAFVVPHGEELRLAFNADPRVSVTIDAATGIYILHDETIARACMVMTHSEQCLLDHVLDCLTNLDRGHAGRAADHAIGDLIGHSLAEIERGVILRTVRHFKADYHRAAAVLGLTEERLRQHVLHYVSDGSGASGGGL